MMLVIWYSHSHNIHIICLCQPLLVGAAVVAIAAVLNTCMLIEPKDIIASRSRERDELGLGDIEDEDDEGHVEGPTELNKKTFFNIILGALGDNIGSSGLMPLCMSPLAFNAFYEDFEKQGLTPIMSQVGYKWISVLVALMGKICLSMIFSDVHCWFLMLMYPYFLCSRSWYPIVTARLQFDWLGWRMHTWKCHHWSVEHFAWYSIRLCGCS